LKSREFFQEAIDRDPNYAIAYAGMAHYYGFAAATGAFPPDENWPKSESALTRAMAIDDSVAESYNALAGIQLYYHRDWPAAERSFRRGIELNPESAEVHHHYGRCLYLFGRNEEAISELKRTVELEPLSMRYQLNLAIAFYVVGDYDRALEQIHKTLDLEPNYTPAHNWLGNLYEKKNNQREAIAEWSRALVLARQTETAKLLEQTYASSGFNSAVRALAQTRLDALKESEKRDEYVAASEYANVYKRLGKKELAYEWLEKALQERSRFAFEVRVDPFYDDFRKEARFQNLLRRYGFAL
jgi:tetratricopeptide (TPR) repeat protein